MLIHQGPPGALGGDRSHLHDVPPSGQPQHHTQHHQPLGPPHFVHPHHGDDLIATFQHQPPTGGTYQAGLKRPSQSPEIGETL
jgi:hypothetical protein